MFLQISQNSQENSCARVSVLIKLQAETFNFILKRLWHRCFPVNFVKFLRTAFLQNTSRRLLFCFHWTAICNGSLRNRPISDPIQKQPPEVFCKKGVLRNFAKFTGKHLCQSFFFNKVAGLTASANLTATW